MTHAPTHILLVEDEISLAETLIFNLEEEGYHVTHAADLANAHAVLFPDLQTSTQLAPSSPKPQLIILDVMLPDGNGIDFAQRIRQENNHTPILMLTALNDTSHIIAGLEAGADDYMSKPFALGELFMRMKKILQRSQAAPNPSTLTPASYQLHALHINLHSGLVSGKKKDFFITSIELKLLTYFITHPLQELHRHDIMAAVWDVPSTVQSRTLDNFVLRLRKIFERKHTQPKHFITLYGVGYRFIP